MTTLDLGCGNDKVQGAVGVDCVSSKGVDVVADVFTFLPTLPSESVDKVVARQFIEHVDCLALVKEIYRVLKADGVVTVETPNSLCVANIVYAALRKYPSYKTKEHVHIFSEFELRNLFRIVGFKTVSVQWFNDFTRMKRNRKRFLKVGLMLLVCALFPRFSRDIRIVAIKTVTVP